MLNSILCRWFSLEVLLIAGLFKVQNLEALILQSLLENPGGTVSDRLCPFHL